MWFISVPGFYTKQNYKHNIEQRSQRIYSVIVNLANPCIVVDDTAWLWWKIWICAQKYNFCKHGQIGGSLIKLYETWDQHLTNLLLCFLFVVIGYEKVIWTLNVNTENVIWTLNTAIYQRTTLIITFPLGSPLIFPFIIRPPSFLSSHNKTPRNPRGRCVNKCIIILSVGNIHTISHMGCWGHIYLCQFWMRLFSFLF